MPKTWHLILYCPYRDHVPILWNLAPIWYHISLVSYNKYKTKSITIIVRNALRNNAKTLWEEVSLLHHHDHSWWVAKNHHFMNNQSMKQTLIPFSFLSICGEGKVGWRIFEHDIWIISTISTKKLKVYNLHHCEVWREFRPSQYDGWSSFHQARNKA